MSLDITLGRSDRIWFTEITPTATGNQPHESPDRLPDAGRSITRTKSMVDVTSADVERLYAASHDSLLNEADRQDHLGIRHGYFTEEVEDEAEAIREMRLTVADEVGVTAGERVLDVGCGFGEDAVWLADDVEARVVGVNICEEQLAVGQQLAAERGVDDAVSFRADDFHELSTVPDDSVDVIWCLEALCHARRDELVVEAFRRVLEDGGRLVVADLFRTSDADAQRSASIRKTCEGLLVNPEPLDDLLTTLEDKGFVDLTERNITEEILPSARRYYWYGLISNPIYRLRGVISSSPAYQHLASSASGFRHQYKSITSGELTYALISAEMET